MKQFNLIPYQIDFKYYKQDAWELKGAKMIEIDGKEYKADTWYTMRNGQIVEWKK